MSRYSSRKRRKDFLGWLLILMSLVAVGFFVYLYHGATSSSVALNSDTFCPEKGPHSITVVLIDTTDPLDAVQKESVQKQLEDIKNSVPRYGEIALFTVRVSGDTLLSPKLTLCNPGRGADISPISGNPTLVDKRWHTAFADKIGQALGELLTSQSTDISPIMESIQQVSVQEFLGKDLETVPKQLVIVSDMLQNTAGFSQYHGVEPFDTFRQSPYYIKVRTSLSKVEVTLFYLRRSTSGNLQGRRHIEFWENYFKDAGATLVDVKSVDG